MTDSGVYMYAVARDDSDAGPDLRGVLDVPVHKVSRAGLAAYVSEVPLDQFGEEPLTRLLEDLDWVGEVARAHHRVVEAVAGAGPAAPVRLVTVYGGEDQVCDLLERRHDDFEEVLTRVGDRKEWGVKAYADPAALQRTAGGEPGTETGAVSERPGTAYLQRRSAGLRDRDRLRKQAVAWAERLHAALCEVAVAGRRHRPQDPSLSGRDDWMVLNGAYLVDGGRERELAAVVAAFAKMSALAGGDVGGGKEAAPWLDVEVTGPWAPYSFTSLELDRDHVRPEQGRPERGEHGRPERGEPRRGEERRGDGGVR
ncbi:gas vesicle protein [Planotetraspora thailandica]|uniref:Gas vesicle protein n=1 Tax=Planotetraspora thailandica TaxID=487172 RepID=A0A8J3Y2A0_9ACTN|nr:GvpL/GvpF family gas vesicle protein [Planotetraspora thailandica]GII59469.1 gas vesicle protein [Planotetraspora thailandica]